ncbi:MAG: hypothetical protein R3A80_13120 [Bdellovibrionota bacterium]
MLLLSQFFMLYLLVMGQIYEMILPRNSDTCACSVAYTDSGIVSVRDAAVDHGVLVDAVHTYKGCL